LEGTLRSYTKEVRDKMKAALSQVAEFAAGFFGAASEVNFLTTYDPVVNDTSLYNKLQQNLPPDIKLIEVEPALTGEDFGFFTTKYRGLMFWLGSGEKKEDLHSPKFLPDEEAITIGLKTFLSLIN
jgi:metal-dependent amidase/aminoacylase/carboxypeptidase family protein